MKLKYLIVIFLLILPSGKIFSQNDINLKDSLTEKECDIILKNKKILKDVHVENVIDSFVYVNKSLRKISINEVKNVRIAYTSGFNHGAILGAAAATLISVLYEFVVLPGTKGHALTAGAIAVVPASLLFGLGGSIFNYDWTYDFPEENVKAKIDRLRYILSKNK